jgi:PAS domain S-box-containing protein
MPGHEKERDIARGEFDVTDSLLDNEVVGIAVLDRDHRYIVFNTGAERLTGYVRDEVVGGADPPTLFPEEEHKAIWDVFGSWATVKNMETRMVRKDGGVRDVLLSMTGRRGESGEIEEYVQFFIDNTERKHLQDLLLHSQKMEVVSEMAGGIAHDFNNLLEGILGYTTFMLDLIDEEHELRSYLEIIEQSVRRASELTERLLTFSGDIKKEEARVHVNTLLQEVAKLLERTVDKNVMIELSLDKNAKSVLGGAGQLEQAFLSVCINARDAMPDGGRIVISSEDIFIDETYPRISLNMRRGSYVRVSISDTGVGMDEETRSKIFKPFFTTKKRSEGTGLGLNVVHGIVNRHGGFIKIYSEPGEGTVFNIYLPTIDSEARRDLAPSAEIPRGAGEVILVIDDEPVICDLDRSMLEKLGYRVLTAGNATDGLRLFKENMGEIQLVILDVIMPGGGGREMLEALKESKPDIRALLSSGYNKSFVGEEFFSDERIGFIQKPYSMQDLATSVRRILDRGRG